MDLSKLDFFQLLIILLIGHFLADYPLQGDFLSKAKNKYSVLMGNDIWAYAMTAHCGIHAGFVLFITSSFLAAWFIFITHFIIDYVKCAGKITFKQDQWLHFVMLAIVAAAISLKYLE